MFESFMSSLSSAGDKMAGFFNPKNWSDKIGSIFKDENGIGEGISK